MNITYNCQFYPDHETSGNDLWFDLLTDGKLDKNECNLFCNLCNIFAFSKRSNSVNNFNNYVRNILNLNRN